MISTILFLSLVFISPSRTCDYRVFVTTNRYEADLWVWRTNDKYQANRTEHVWSITPNKYESNFSVSLVNSKYNSDLVIFYTEDKYQSGWKKPHRLKKVLNIR